VNPRGGGYNPLMNQRSANSTISPSPVRETHVFIPLAAKLSAVTGLLVAAVVLLTGLLFARQEWRGLLLHAAERAETLAAAGVGSVDVADQFSTIASPAPRQTESWRRTYRKLLELRERTGSFSHLTTLIPVGRRYAQVVVSTHERFEPGMLVKLPAQASTLFGEKGEILRSSSHCPVLRSNGLTESVSAFVPAPASDGRIGVILEADVSGDEIGSYFASRKGTILIESVLAGVTGLLLAALIAIAATAPTTELVALARHVARGDLEHEIVPHSHDELGLLADSLEKMRLALREKLRALEESNESLSSSVRARTAELAETLAEVRAQQEKVRHAMEIAKGIQASISPKSVSRGRFDIDVRYVPLEEIGGDLGLIYLLSDEELVVAVGDVSGHGVGAALLGNRVHTLLTRHAAERTALEESAGDINAALFESVGRQGRFASLFIARIDARSGVMQYVNAGHPAAVIVGGRDGEPRMLPATDTVLGIREPGEFAAEVGRVEIAPGQTVIFFTDGLIEAACEEGTFFGMERVMAIARDSGDRTPREITEAMTAEAEKFARGMTFDDDLTVIAVRIL